MKRISFSLLALLAFSTCAFGNIIWIFRALDGEPSHPPIEVDYLTWQSTNVVTLHGQKSVNIQSSNPSDTKTIYKSFQTNIPHAFLIVQATFYEIGCLSEEEGFRLRITNSPTTYERYDSANRLFGCEEGQINTYIQRFTFPETDNSFTISFTALLNGPTSASRGISISNFRLGVIGCDPSCSSCHLSNDPNSDMTICDSCPANATLNVDKNICECNPKYEADISSGILVCNSESSGEVSDGEISTACRTELNNFSSRTRVNVITSEEQSENGASILAHVDYFHFFSVISSACASLLRVKVVHFNNDSETYADLPSKYIKNKIFGDYIDVEIDLADFASLANSVVDKEGTTIQTIRLALKFNVGSVATRIHDFDLINQISGESHDFASFNEDYQLNMNFISPLSSFNNPSSFVKEFLFDIKRYLCVDASCVLSREFQGYEFNEEIIVKIQYRSNQNKQHLSLIEAHVFGNEEEFNALGDVTILSSGDGFLILSLHQKYVTTDLNNSQATNKAYLQFTVQYHDNASDVNSKVRYGQAVILFYALYTAPN